MRKIVVAVDSQDTIKLGYLGENNFQVVKFDISDWLRDHKNGKAVLLFKVNGMDAPYPCKVEIQGNYANWILTKADLQQGRNGKCQLIYYAHGEVIAKSSIFCTDVANSLGEQTSEPPEAFTSWVNDVLASGILAENSAKEAFRIQQEMNDTLQSAKQIFDSAVSQGVSSIEDAKKQVAQQAEQSTSQLNETADTACKSVLDALTEGLNHIATAQTQAATAVTDEGDRQAERLNALVPDGYYTKEESDVRYAQIDNTRTAQETTWSSENIVNRLCPPFEMSGKVVTCQPVEGSSLSISCENALSGGMTIWQGGKNMIGGNILSAGSVNINNQQLITSNPYGTTISSTNVSEGKVIVTQSKAENPDRPEDYYNGYIYVLLPEILKDGDVITFSMKFRLTNSLLENVSSLEFMRYGQARLPAINIDPVSLEEQTIVVQDIWRVYNTTGRKTSYEIRLCGFSMEILSIQLEWGSKATEYEPYRGKFQSLMLPGTIPALSGTNTIYADSGNITVSGYANPKTIINTLTERIEALEQNAIGG